VTNLAEATDLIFKDWVAYAGALSPVPPYVFENEDQPGATTPLFEGSVPWYRVAVRELAGGRANLNGVVGTRKYERTGLLQIQYFNKTNIGVKDITTVAEAVRDYFEDRRLTNDVIYLAADVRRQPPDGKWKPILVEVTFEFTDRK
jgi:hypothetical protein